MIGLTYPNAKSVKILWKNDSVRSIGAFNVLFKVPAKYDIYLITYVMYAYDNVAIRYDQIATFVNENTFKTGATMKEDDNGSSYPVSAGYNTSRKATLSSDNKSVAFTNGYFGNEGHGINEDCCVPTAIYGINL